MQEIRQRMAQSLLDKQNLLPKELSESTGAPIIQIYKAAKDLEKEGLIVITESESGKVYTPKNTEALKSICDVSTDTVSESNSKAPKKKPVKTKIEVPTSGRHTGKFVFRKVPYSQSQCVYQVMAAYIAEQKPTYKELEAAFDPSIVSRFGVFAKLSKCRELSADRDRYHLKDYMILKTKDGVRIAITNQWSMTRFIQFVDAASQAGYKIRPHEPVNEKD